MVRNVFSRRMLRSTRIANRRPTTSAATVNTTSNTSVFRSAQYSCVCGPESRPPFQTLLKNRS
jgi:hypothetical protein